ncbi:hypothetical protein [Parabacteroides sp. PF5-9]|uniref:hypothetical protein n=1 Tax=Parabacteroides sp. PF5-9 TaxID=1742404 RepID=UPI0024746C3D|nr:hypothetical protein [Parabacteroides sp. PF5-9]MDH6359186.1 hypothetical protein [Parabacteroides sp. PF5-9]
MKNRTTELLWSSVILFKSIAMIGWLVLFLILTSACDKKDEPTPPPTPSATSHHFNIDSMSALDSNLSDLQAKANGNNGRDTLYANFTNHLKIASATQAANFETVQKLVDLNNKTNVYLIWNDFGVYAGDDIYLTSENAKTLAGVLKSGAKLLAIDDKLFYISSVDVDLFRAEELAVMGLANEKVIKNAAEFVEKCQSATAGDVIVIDRQISTEIDNAIELGSAIERECSLRLSNNAQLEFVVDKDVNLAHKKLDVISNHLGDAQIQVKVKTASSGKPYITTFNDVLFKNAMTKATWGKQQYNVTFIDEGNQIMNPRVCGTRDVNDHWTPITDSTYFASCTSIDVGVYGGMTGSWEILMESGFLNDVGVENGVFTAQLVLSPTEMIDFNYPMPSVGGKYVHDKPDIFWWQDAYMPDKLTYISVGEWFDGDVLSGQTKEVEGSPIICYLGFPYNPFSLTIRGADNLAFCCHYTRFFPLISSDSGSIYDRGKDAVTNLKRTATYTQDKNQLYFTTLSGDPVEQIVVLNGSMDPKNHPFPNMLGATPDYTTTDILLLNPLKVR